MNLELSTTCHNKIKSFSRLFNPLNKSQFSRQIEIFTNFTNFLPTKNSIFVLVFLWDRSGNTAKQNKTLRKVAKNSKIMVVVSNLGPPEAGIIIQEAGVQTYINEKNLGKGKLYISEARVSWVGDAGHTFSLEYNHIALHAVSRDVTAFPNAENLYLMIDVKLVESEPGTPR